MEIEIGTNLAEAIVGVVAMIGVFGFGALVLWVVLKLLAMVIWR